MSASSTFKDSFELSKETLAGLRFAGFTEPTQIQKQVIKPALEGKDVLASAKTGSGKTLAFVIPLLECLYKEKWSNHDGLGAIVITPTRELAYQIFEVLRTVGQRHDFSAALVIGGKDLAMERKRIDQINIIICTPGRIQQHMEENPLFYAQNCKMLILDEADQMLEKGFEDSINYIIDFLPQQRQCLLFSATLTNSVKDLARLSLSEPVSISVDSEATQTTPDSLRQKYTVINLEQKLSFIWSFIKRHKKSKILIFIATCKQTRFLNDLFCRMKPGVSINALHGGLSQPKRMDIYNKFRDVRHCVMLATDVAARGLDFPDVDWVVQLDCPMDPKTYIHRVGRTARFDKSGRSFIVLMPNEKDFMLDKLNKFKIPIEEIPTHEKHLFFIQSTVDSNLARDVNLKEGAKRAFKSYIDSLLKDFYKPMFDAEQLDLKAYARSLGLEVTPRVRILERRGIQVKKSGKGLNQKKNHLKGGDSVDECSFEAPGDTSDEDDEDLLRPAKKQRKIVDDDDEEIKPVENLDELEWAKLDQRKNLTKAKKAKLLMKKKLQINKHVIFNKDNT